MPQELLIALIAASAALFGSLLGAFLTRTTEHKQWHRNEKKKAYSDYVSALDEIRKDIQTAPNTVIAARFYTLSSSRSNIRLFGSAAVRTLAREADVAVHQYWIKTREAYGADGEDEQLAAREAEHKSAEIIIHLLRYMRQDLHVSDPQDDWIDTENARTLEQGGSNEPKLPE